MGSTSKKRSGKRSAVPSALLAGALATTARSPLGETEFLGFLERVTSKGFRLVWEDGSLILVAYSPSRLNASLVTGVRKRLDWIVANRDEVQKRLHAVVGPTANAHGCDVRVAVCGDDKACRSALNQLSSSVELRIVPVDRLATPGPWVPKRYMLGAKNKARTTPMNRQGHAPPTIVRAHGCDLPSLLLELHQVVTAILHPGTWSDPDDWRCCQPLNLVRLYGLLVTIGCALAVTPSSSNRQKGNGTKAVEPVRPAVAQGIFESLGVFAEAIARNCFHPSDRTVARTLRRLRSVLKSLGGHEKGSHGAYLGVAWRSPVPPDFGAFVASMVAASNISKPVGPRPSEQRTVSRLLTETNFGVASSVHFAQTFDQRCWPRYPVSEDLEYRQAAIARVLAGHRLLLELLGVSSLASVNAILSFAHDIALQKTFDDFWNAGKQSQDFLVATRKGAVAVLSGTGKVTAFGKRRATLRRVAIAQETAVVGAMEAVATTGGD